MIVSNLTTRQREVLELLPTVEPKWGMAIKIAAKMKPTNLAYGELPPQPNNVQTYLSQLVDSGHVIRVSRGVYKICES